MDFEFSRDGKTYSVRLEKTGSGEYKAFLGDEEIPFTASVISSNSYSMIIDGQSKVIYVAESNSNLFVHLDGQVMKLDKVTGDKNSFGAAGEIFGAKDEVSTPMPGKIVKVLVAVGEKVTLKQALVIVESMKMENKIVSPTDGEIKSIHFSEGDLVEPGQPIIKLIPTES